MTSTKTTIYNNYMPLKKNDQYQLNFSIEPSKTMSDRKLHNSRVHNIYLLQYNAPQKHLVFSRVPTKYQGVNHCCCWSSSNNNSIFTRLQAFFFNFGNCMQFFFLYVAIVTIWNFGAKPKRVFSFDFTSTYNITFIEVKINTSLGSNSNLQTHVSFLNICFRLVVKTLTFSSTHALIEVITGNHVLICTKAQTVKHETLL